MTALTPTPISMHERLRTDYHWTPRQRQVLDLIAQGKSNAEIAATLDVSLQGAKWHVSEILDKLDAGSREEAADYWRRYNGLAPRFARVFRGFVGLAAVKWAGAATGIAAVAAGGMTIAAVAGGGGDDGAPAAVSPTPAAEDVLARLRADEWILVDVAGVPARDDVEATLRFTDPGPQAESVHPQPGTAGWAGGEASCNGFNGGVDISGDRITFRDVIRTLMACDAIDQEERYLGALQKAERLAFDGDQLLIFAAGYDAPLRFRPVPIVEPTPTSTPTAGLDVSFDEYRAKPRPEATIAGITIGPSVGRVESPACESGEPVLIPADAAQGTTVELNPTALPVGVSVGSANAVSCASEVVAHRLNLQVAPDPAGAGHDGGPITAFRDSTDGSRRRTDVPAEYWREITIAGQPAALAVVRVDHRYMIEIVVWDPAAHVLTTFVGDSLPPEVVLSAAEAILSK